MKQALALINLSSLTGDVPHLPEGGENENRKKSKNNSDLRREGCPLLSYAGTEDPEIAKTKIKKQFAGARREDKAVFRTTPGEDWRHPALRFFTSFQNDNGGCGPRSLSVLLQE